MKVIQQKGFVVLRFTKITTWERLAKLKSKGTQADYYSQGYESLHVIEVWV